jgi:hypothetical protein
MKKFFRSMMILLVFLSLSLNISCDIFRNIDPELKVKRDAYYTIVEAHALKQLWIYEFLGTFSDNYTKGQLFVYEPTIDELDELWDEFNVLMSYTDAVEAAVDTLEALENDPLAKGFNKTLVSSGVVSSLFEFFGAGSDVSKNSRNRILTIISNMPQSEKTELFNDMLRTKWRREFSDENDFWTKLQNGEIDDKASQIYNDFYGGSFTSDNNTFGTLALDKNLTPGKIFVKEGAKLVEKGAAVIVETAKAATPLGAGIDVVEAGKKWWEKGEKLVDKPMDLVKDEIKERIAGKIAGIVDVDGALDAVGIGEGAGTAVKTLMDASIGTSDTQELIEKGIDWGMAKISSPDKSIDPEIVVAENQNPGLGLPDIILGVGNYVNQIGETLLTLPEGDWDITARDAWGQTNTPSTTTIVAQQETQVDISISSNDDVVAGDSLDINSLDFDGCDCFYFVLNSGNSQYSFYNRPDSGQILSWTKNTFSLSYEETLWGIDYETSFSGNVSLISYDQAGLYATAIEIRSYYNDDGNIAQKYEMEVTLHGLPLTNIWRALGDKIIYSFEIAPNKNVDLLSSIGTFVSYTYRTTHYSTDGETLGNIESQTLISDFDFSTSQSPSIWVTLSPGGD